MIKFLGSFELPAPMSQGGAIGYSFNTSAPIPGKPPLTVTRTPMQSDAVLSGPESIQFSSPDAIEAPHGSTLSSNSIKTSRDEKLAEIARRKEERKQVSLIRIKTSTEVLIYEFSV